ncbi:ABC transporter permease [Propionibacteriaceae bacterium G1746]
MSGHPRGYTAGARTLLRTTLHHDGRNFGPFAALATLLSASSVLIYPWLFPDAFDRFAFSTAVGANPAIGLVFGPAFDLTTDEGFNAWRSLALGGFIAALGAAFAVTRNTRGQEDSGQAELLASGVLGRGARLGAAVGMGVLGSLLLGIVAATVTILCGGTVVASTLLAATFTCTGWMFTGVAAVAAQLGADARTSNTLAIGTLGTLFVLRGFAYAIDAPQWTIWVNPLGWMTETRPASGNHLWPLLLAVGLTLVLLTVAFIMESRRDFGQGVISPRPGPARGRVHTTRGLALRLNYSSILLWLAVMVMLGFVFGYMTVSVKDILAEQPGVAAVLAAGATTADQLVGVFLHTIIALLGIVASVPGVLVMLKVHSEEREDRLEPVIATRARRITYYAANVLLALGLVAVLVLLAGAVIGLRVQGSDVGLSFGDVVWQAAATVPAVWAVVALSVAVVGARPGVAIAAWAGVPVTFLLTLLGPSFKLPDWALGISPYWHVPAVANPDRDWWGLLGVAGVTAVLLVVGFAGFRRRDLAR